MKITNILLILLIGIVAFQKIPEKKKETVSDKKETISIKSVQREYKTVKARVKNKDNVKHSTTFRSYLDTDGRSTLGVSHNIRVGRNWYTSFGVTARETSYNKQDVSFTGSITKYWGN